MTAAVVTGPAATLTANVRRAARPDGRTATDMYELLSEAVNLRE